MNRREIVLVGLTAAGSIVLTSARAQAIPPPETVEPASLAERLANPENLSRVFVDTAFVQLWRAELAPRGYENSGEWYADAAANRSRVSEMLGGDVVSAIMRNDQSVAEYQQTILAKFSDLSGGFAEFLSVIGIAPEGRAGRRLVESLRDFALLNAAVLPVEDREEVEKASFMWPFC